MVTTFSQHLLWHVQCDHARSNDHNNRLTTFQEHWEALSQHCCEGSGSNGLNIGSQQMLWQMLWPFIGPWGRTASSLYFSRSLALRPSESRQESRDGSFLQLSSTVIRVKTKREKTLEATACTLITNLSRFTFNASTRKSGDESAMRVSGPVVLVWPQYEFRALVIISRKSHYGVLVYLMSVIFYP